MKKSVEPYRPLHELRLLFWPNTIKPWIHEMILMAGDEMLAMTQIDESDLVKASNVAEALAKALNELAERSGVNIRDVYRVVEREQRLLEVEKIIKRESPPPPAKAKRKLELAPEVQKRSGWDRLFHDIGQALFASAGSSRLGTLGEREVGEDDDQKGKEDRPSR